MHAGNLYCLRILDAIYLLISYGLDTNNKDKRKSAIPKKHAYTAADNEFCPQQKPLQKRCGLRKSLTANTRKRRGFPMMKPKCTTSKRAKYSHNHSSLFQRHNINLHQSGEENFENLTNKRSEQPTRIMTTKEADSLTVPAKPIILNRYTLYRFGNMGYQAYVRVRINAIIMNILDATCILHILDAEI